MSHPKKTHQLLSFSEVLVDEYEKLCSGEKEKEEKEKRKYEELRGELASIKPEGGTDEEIEEDRENQRLKKIFKSIHGLDRKRSALCLSGGGIRSATFCFGVLQGLAKYHLLEKFDYLSTVSGGGYIGSWLTAWIHRTKAGETPVHAKLRERPASTTEPEPPEITHLRAYSNYLSPKVGLLSVDTWTLAAIYLRNLFLNWLVLLPFLLAVLLIPRMYVSFILRNFAGETRSSFSQAGLNRWSWVLLGLGLVSGAWALAYIGSHRPSLRKAGRTGKQTPDDLRHFQYFCMIPLGAAVFLLTVGRSWLLESGESLTLPEFMMGGAALHVLGWLLTPVCVLIFFKQAVFLDFVNKLGSRVLEFIVVGITGLLGGAFLWLLSIPEKLHRITPDDHPEMYACLDGPQLMLVFLLMGMLTVGIGSRSINDADREWWARAGAWVLIAIVIWAVLNSLVLYGPQLLPYLWAVDEKLNTPIASLLGGPLVSLGIISGFVTILFGVSSKTPANDRQAEKAGRLTTVMDYAVKASAPVFVLFLVVLLSYFTDRLTRLIWLLPNIYNSKYWHIPRSREWQPFFDFSHEEIVDQSSFLFLLVMGAVMVSCSLFMSSRINVNKFSLHSMYRNRLVRAYLGASNQKDRAASVNPFTGFHPDDDIKMSNLWPDASCESGAKDCRPLHIVNMTWNLVGGKKLAWQHRKATTFTVSPLHCGNYINGYRRSEVYGGDPNSITLGTALAISGAAASPNMGYYSSSAVTFLMTLFNVRLGWWLGNPARQQYRQPGPRFALWSMIKEAFGQTDDDKDFIYLSDGGHFENLGLYEMVLRRCHYIFVVDASSDPDYKFENLGNAIRRIRIDLGVTIEISGIVNYPTKQEAPGAYCAIGDILYSGVDAGAEEDGVLIYIKPALRKGVPTDIFNYAKANLKFPHESVGDQFFSEQQFESYRALGLHAVVQIFRKDWMGTGGEEVQHIKGFDDLKNYVEKYIEDSNAPGKPGGEAASDKSSTPPLH